MEHTIKLVAKLPDGELDGWNSSPGAAEALYQEASDGLSVQPGVSIIIHDVDKFDGQPPKNTRTVSFKVLRVQPVTTAAGRALIRDLLVSEYSDEHGPTVPFGMAALSRAAFADLPEDPSVVDEREERERDEMSPTDELRRHLERVHGRPEAAGMTDLEADHQHGADHAGDLPDALAHDPEWMGWTRADLEAATADSDGDNGSGITIDMGGEGGSVIHGNAFDPSLRPDPEDDGETETANLHEGSAQTAQDAPEPDGALVLPFVPADR